MRVGSHSICVLLVAGLFTLEPQHSRAQNATGTDAGCQQVNGKTGQGSGCSVRLPIIFSLTIAGDGGKDRYGTLVMERGKWKFENINWVSPDGGDAVSLMLAGRKFTIAKHAQAEILVGPRYEHLNRAWDEAVVDTNVRIQQSRLRCTFINHWGFPLRASGDFFDSHTQTISGLARVPKWIVANFYEKQTAGHLDRFDAGVGFIRYGRISFTAVPYWDFKRETADIRVGISYTRAFR